MIRFATACALLLVALTTARPASAQGFSPPGQAGADSPSGAFPSGTPPAGAFAPATPPAGAFPPATPSAGAFAPAPPQAGAFAPAAPSAGAFAPPAGAPQAFAPSAAQPATPPSGFPGFGAPQAGAPAAQPARQNFADELTDFGVPPRSTLKNTVAAPTPLTIPGGHVITTSEVRQAVGSNILFIDVWDAPAHPSLPGAIPMPGAGSPGSFSDATQHRLWAALDRLTGHQAAHPILFFCTGSRCWESYNAALRAINMGFTMVLWYRGGLAAWHAAGLPMTTPGQAGAGGMANQGQVGFGH